MSTMLLELLSWVPRRNVVKFTGFVCTIEMCLKPPIKRALKGHHVIRIVKRFLETLIWLILTPDVVSACQDKCSDHMAI